MIIHYILELLEISKLNIPLISKIFFLIASFFYLTAAIGIIRLPGVINKLHATGLSDITGFFFLIFACIFYFGFSIHSLKLFFLFILMLINSPIISNQIASKAYYIDNEPIINNED